MAKHSAVECAAVPSRQPQGHPRGHALWVLACVERVAAVALTFKGFRDVPGRRLLPHCTNPPFCTWEKLGSLLPY